jgi:hypothetical protein
MRPTDSRKEPEFFEEKPEQIEVTRLSRKEQEIAAIKEALRQAQIVEAQCIIELTKRLGVPETLADYEGELCERPQGQGFPVCPFSNSPHCVKYLEEKIRGDFNPGQAE